MDLPCVSPHPACHPSRSLEFFGRLKHISELPLRTSKLREAPASFSLCACHRKQGPTLSTGCQHRFSKLATAISRLKLFNTTSPEALELCLNLLHMLGKVQPENGSKLQPLLGGLSTSSTALRRTCHGLTYLANLLSLKLRLQLLQFFP